MRNTCLLLLMMAHALAGCANSSAMSAPMTATDASPDRILVTIRMDEFDGVAKLSPSGRLDYLPPSAAQVREHHLDRAREISASFALQLEEDWPIPALDVYCFVFRLDEPAQRDAIVMALAAHPEIESVQPLNFFHVQGDPGHGESGDPLAEGQPSLASELARAHRMATGRNVGIAVVDTGADLRHEDLANANIKAIDLVGEIAGSNTGVPAEHHGTAIVGVIAADRNNGKGISGYAPDAEILLLRACWQPEPRNERAICNSFTLAKALSYSLASDAAIVNLSISGPRDPLLEKLAGVLVERGVLLVAGGHSPETFPASVNGSLVAANVLANADQQVMTLLPDDRYGVRSGTSLDAARVSGIAALILQFAPKLTVAELQRRIGLLRSQPIHSALAGLPAPHVRE